MAGSASFEWFEKPLLVSLTEETPGSTIPGIPGSLYEVQYYVSADSPRRRPTTFIRLHREL